MLRGFRNFLMRGDVIVVAVGLVVAPVQVPDALGKRFRAIVPEKSVSSPRVNSRKMSKRETSTARKVTRAVRDGSLI
jgi:hypothetical protein